MKKGGLETNFKEKFSKMNFTFSSPSLTMYLIYNVIFAPMLTLSKMTSIFRSNQQKKSLRISLHFIDLAQS